MIGGTGDDATPPDPRARTALRLARDFGIGVVWLIVVLGTVAAWFGLDILGGLTLGGFLDSSYSSGPAVVVTVGGFVAAMTLVMSVVWRRGRGDSWFFLLWILMGFLFVLGVPTLIAVAFSNPVAGDHTDAVGSATGILTSVGYAIPLAGSLLAMLVASRKVFPTWGPVGAGFLAVVAEALGIGIWVVLSVTLR